ncbi:MAG: serine/threonine-protein kinase [Bryobacterales bacterium]|nr:serine/threonine-protein kinase [Bryobacterales bacterium]
MTVDKWREVFSCYKAALEEPPERRRRFLESTDADPEVREKALRMLEALERNTGELTAGAPAPKGPARTGTTVGRYEVGVPLGEGGMGEVYSGWDPALDRAVALKFLRRERTGLPAEAARFVREAKAASALNHPNIVTIHEVIQGGGSLVIVMELVEGQSARELCEAPVPLKTLLDLGRQTALALAAAHANGIIHRDVKPENIMVRTDGYVKLLDFGLARRIALDEGSGAGLPEGTLRYMSPEQVRGMRLTPATDIYSLGLALAELASGRHPYANCPTLDVPAAIVREPGRGAIVLDPSLPARLASLIEAMLSGEPARRPAASEVAAALRGIAESSATGASVAAVRGTAGLRKPRLWLAGVAGLVGAAALVVWSWPAGPRPSVPEWIARPLTSQPGWEESPSFSPDGQAVAFTWTEKLNQPRQIYVKHLDADAPVPLTRPGLDVGPLAWSPDGNTIAFKVAYRAGGGAGGIYAIPKQGGEEVKLTGLANVNFSTSLDWSPDGSQIVFSDLVPGTEQLAIYAFDVNSRTRRRLTSPPRGDWGDWDPRFSPDGRTLAFKRVRGFWRDAVYLMAAGGRIRRLVEDSDVIWGHAWMPDGNGLIVSTPLGGSLLRLWRFPLSPGLEPVRITGEGLDAITPASAHRSGRIAWVSRLEDTNIYRIPATGTGAPVQLIASTRRDERACYSPDGRIAFASDRSGSWEIWIAGSDGSNQVRVTNLGRSLTGFPRWSPDGRRLAFETKAFDSGSVFVLECQPGSADCGEPVRLTEAPRAENWTAALPSWSADGAHVYFASNRTGRHEVWKQALAGGPAVQVTRRGGYASQESRDGKWLYFSKLDPLSIWRMPGSRPDASAGSAGEQLLIGPPSIVSPAGWTLTPDEILFIDFSGAGPYRRIVGYALASARTRTVATLPDIPERGTDVSVSPDSRWVLYGQLDRSGSNIMVAAASR